VARSGFWEYISMFFRRSFSYAMVTTTADRVEHLSVAVDHSRADVYVGWWLVVFGIHPLPNRKRTCFAPDRTDLLCNIPALRPSLSKRLQMLLNSSPARRSWCTFQISAAM
jgi:hypothetical protein